MTLPPRTSSVAARWFQRGLWQELYEDQHRRRLLSYTDAVAAMAMTSLCLCMYAGFLVALQSPALRLFFTRGVQNQDLAA